MSAAAAESAYLPDVCWKSKVKRTHIIPSMLYYTFIFYTYTHYSLNDVYIRQRYTHVQEYLSTRVPVMVGSPSVSDMIIYTVHI